MWRKENSTIFCFTPSFNPADFHKYENYELENKFYEDQINQRVMFVSKEIDEEYEQKRSSRIAQLQDAENRQEVSESALNASVSRSSLIRQTKSINSMGSQADFCHIDQPPVRKVKLCTEKELKHHQKKLAKQHKHFQKIFLVTITIFRMKKNTLNKLLKCLTLLKTTLVMLTYLQIKND